MSSLVSKWLYIAAAIGVALGLVAVLLSSGWTAFSQCVVWYSTWKWQTSVLLLPALIFVGGCLVTVVILVVQGRSSPAGARVGPGGGAARMDKERMLRQARWILDKQIARPSPKMEAVIDALLGVCLDVEAQELYMDPGPMGVEVSLKADGDLLPVTSLPTGMYQKVLHRLRQMIHATKTGQGVVDFHSSSGVEQIRISLEQSYAGIGTRLQVLGTTSSVPQVHQQPGRRKRPSSVVFRLEPEAIGDITGEFRVLPVDGKKTGENTGRFMLSDPSGSQEIAPLVRAASVRTVGAVESWVRLALAACAALLVIIFFSDAYAWAMSRVVSGHQGVPWRDVTLVLRADPVPGEVSIQGQSRGRTPLVTVEPCRGQAIEVLVRAQGYSPWQWGGICPDRGPLQLHARLKLQR